MGLGFWWALALACVAVTALLLWPARVLLQLAPVAAMGDSTAVAFSWRPLGFALAGYAMFGVGYIVLDRKPRFFLNPSGNPPALPG